MGGAPGGRDCCAGREEDLADEQRGEGRGVSGGGGEIWGKERGERKIEVWCVWLNRNFPRIKAFRKGAEDGLGPVLLVLKGETFRLKR